MARRRLQPRFFLFLFSLVGIGAGVFLLVQAFVTRPKEATADGSPSPSAPQVISAAVATPAPALPDNLTVVRSDEADPALYGFSTRLLVNGGETSS